MVVNEDGKDQKLIYKNGLRPKRYEYSKQTELKKTSDNVRQKIKGDSRMISNRNQGEIMFFAAQNSFVAE